MNILNFQNWSYALKLIVFVFNERHFIGNTKYVYDKNISPEFVFSVGLNVRGNGCVHNKRQYSMSYSLWFAVLSHYFLYKESCCVYTGYIIQKSDENENMIVNQVL